MITLDAEEERLTGKIIMEPTLIFLFVLYSSSKCVLAPNPEPRKGKNFSICFSGRICMKFALAIHKLEYSGLSKISYGQWFPEPKIIMVYDESIDPDVECKSLNFERNSETWSKLMNLWMNRSEEM